jgi:RecG-like helicase
MMHSEAIFSNISLHESCVQRLAFEELVSFYLEIGKQKMHSSPGQTTAAWNTNTSKDYSVKLLDSTSFAYFRSLNYLLPFNLTECQRNIVGDVISDLAAPQRMARLLQGDVGSGKSIIAACALAYTLSSKKMGIVLAPTEILAKQHFDFLLRFFSNASRIFGSIYIDLLTSETKGADRRDIMQRVYSRRAGIIVGTHALLSDNFIKSLSDEFVGIVVVDEEQRFGVAQRDSLSQLTNALYTTATPIPRSLSMVSRQGMFKPLRGDVMTVLGCRVSGERVGY